MCRLLLDHLRSFYHYGVKQSYPINYFFKHFLRINTSASFSVHYTSQVEHGRNIDAGAITRRYLARAGNCYYNALSGIEFGEGTIIAPGVKIASRAHVFEDYERLLRGGEYRITIGERCWLGANCVLLPGVKLGDGVIVAAGAVVAHSFPDRRVIAGMPARIIKTPFQFR